MQRVQQLTVFLFCSFSMHAMENTKNNSKDTKTKVEKVIDLSEKCKREQEEARHQKMMDAARYARYNVTGSWYGPITGSFNQD